MQLPILPYVLIVMTVVGSYLISTVVFDAFWQDWTGEERNTEKPPFYWWFNGFCTFASFQIGTFNILFLWFSYWDANRRIWLMR